MRESYDIRDSHSTYKIVNYHYKSIHCTLVEPYTDAIVLFDIGGGASEVILLDVSQKRSFRLTEQIMA